MEQECLNILGFSYHPTEKELKSAYKKLIKQYHPDVTGGETSVEYTRIDTAYKYLTGKMNYREAEAILFPERKTERAAKYQNSENPYASYQGQNPFEEEFFRNFYREHATEYDEQGYYRNHYEVNIGWLKYLPFILLFLFVLLIVFFFQMAIFVAKILFSPVGLVLVAIYLVWRIFIRNRR